MNGEGDSKKQSLGGSLCNLAIQAIIGYYFYKYAFRNPDKTSCFAVDGSEEVYFTD